MGSGASSSATLETTTTTATIVSEDHSWLLDAVNEAWCSPDFQTAVTFFFDEHCHQFPSSTSSTSSPTTDTRHRASNTVQEYSLAQDETFRNYQTLIETRVASIVEMYGCNVSNMLQSLEHKSLDATENDEGLASFVRRLSTYESFKEFAVQMTSHYSSLQQVKSLGTSAALPNNAPNRDQTMGYLAQRTGHGTVGSTATTNGGGGGGGGGGPSKISAPMMYYHPDENKSQGSGTAGKETKDIHTLLAKQEQLVHEMKQRQKKCVQLARPMNIGKPQLKTLFAYVRDAIISQDNDTVEQHMGVIRDILGTSSIEPANDCTLTLATEMHALAQAQNQEEIIQQRIDTILPPGSPLGGATFKHANDEDLTKVLEASRQLYVRTQESNNGTGTTQMGSPTTSMVKRAVITSAAQEADRQARLDADEKNYNKTLEEVILRSKIEAEGVEASRLRKLMLDTAMAAQLSEKDHVNSVLQNELMALEARLANLQTSVSVDSLEKEQTETTLRAELQRKENARKEIQQAMERIVNQSEQKTNALIEEKTQELALAEEKTNIARAKESALRLENSVFKKALKREAKEAEDAKHALDEHRQIASQLRQELEAAKLSHKELGQHSESKTTEVAHLATLLETERKRIAQLESEMKQKTEENERNNQMCLLQAKNEQHQQITLYEEQMAELKELRKQDTTRLLKHQERAEQLQKELAQQGLERERLKTGVEQANQKLITTESKVADMVESQTNELKHVKQINTEREATLTSLQEQILIKEKQLILQLKEIERAKEHETKAHDLQRKLRTELKHKQNLEQRLKDVEESKTASTRESAVQLQALMNAVDDARRVTESTQAEASRELEKMRHQMETERKKHQQQLRETVERELLAVRADTESKVSSLATRARAKENDLMEELEELRKREHTEKQARKLAEEERVKLYAELHERNEVSNRQLRELEQEKELLAIERNTQKEAMAKQLEDLEKKTAKEVFEMKRQTQENFKEQSRREGQKTEQIKQYMMHQVQEQTERAKSHETRAHELAQALHNEEQKRKDVEEQLKKELVTARAQVESKIGEVASKARKEELRLLNELEESKMNSTKQASALQGQLDAQLERLQQLEKERTEAKSEAQRNERVLWQQQEKAQQLHESLAASKRERDVQEQRAHELSKVLKEQEQTRWLLESQLNAARAQASSRDQEVAAQMEAVGKAKEEQLMKMISESRQQTTLVQSELSQAVTAERREKESIKEKMQKITEELMLKVEREKKQRAILESRLQAEMKAATEKVTKKSVARQKHLEKQIQETNEHLTATKQALEEQLNMRNKQLEDERIVREEIEASLAREEKKRAALKRHLKKKLKDQMKEFEEERREMAKKYEKALAVARIAEEKQQSDSRDLKESKRARNEIVSLASAQSTSAVKKLEQELAMMRTQLELQRQQTQDARQEMHAMQGNVPRNNAFDIDVGNVGLNVSNMASHNGATATPTVHLTPRHEKMQKMHIQHEVERETHHERVRQEKARQRAMLKERLERKRGEDRPHSTSVAPGRRPVASAWGGVGLEGEGQGEREREASGGRGKDLKSFYQSGDGGRQINVRSKRPVVDFTID